MLVCRRINTVGVIVHRLDSHFTTSALNGIESVTTSQGYETIITHSQEDSEIEASNARLLLNRGVDGVIASLSSRTESLRHFEAFAENGVPVVFFDRVAKSKNSDVVVIDNSRCGFLATEHLINQGCRRIAIVTSSLERSVYAQRYTGFRSALRKYGMPFSHDLMVLGDIDSESGVEAARRILEMDPLPDGLFITSDLVAAICIHTLKEAGIRVPEDIAVVGFNNDPVGRLITPKLTTIDYNGFEIGKVAAMSLLDQLSGREQEPFGRTAVIPAGLTVRDSSLRRGSVASTRS
ncbi:MAG: substrate-binding domain-containing protein [Bacteroidetes bacterium]|nr:substrate-binding domain-containing protein [Bacteroidota bacterium]